MTDAPLRSYWQKSGPPAPEKVARMQSIQESLKKHGQFDIVLLLLTVSFMATARYW